MFSQFRSAPLVEIITENPAHGIKYVFVDFAPFQPNQADLLSHPQQNLQVKLRYHVSIQ